MDIHEAIAVTQDRLLEEGSSMGELLGHFRNRISPTLIGERQWERVLECATTLPITMGAQPFGFELPLHDRRPEADFGVSLASGNRSGDFFEERCAERRDGRDREGGPAYLRGNRSAELDLCARSWGRKLMLEYDIGSALDGTGSLPGLFLRPNERTLFGRAGLQDDVGTVVDALVSCVGRQRSAAERGNAERVYSGTARGHPPRFVRRLPFSRNAPCALAVMGFRTQHEIRSFLERLDWPGRISTVEDVISRLKERANVVRTGLNLDVRGRRTRFDARPDAYRQAEIHERVTVLDRRPDRLAAPARGPEPRGPRRGGEDRGARRLGIETDHALWEIGPLRAAPRHPPREAGHIRKSATGGQSLCLSWCCPERSQLDVGSRSPRKLAYGSGSGAPRSSKPSRLVSAASMLAVG